MTRKLYYEDPHLSRFTAQVQTCQPDGKHWRITLDATAFYPEGGGQAADTGVLDGVRVLHVRERGEEVEHLCDGPLTPGSQVAGQIDYDARFERMQQHSGEHIVSGLIHSRYGYHNTGFHMGADGLTVDFDGVIPAQALPELERAANAAVWANLSLRCWVPEPEELARLTYRTKRALPWPVRIVEIPGFDRCACCGTHVTATGEIGLIKLFSAVNFRGGTRMEMACGSQALEILNRAYGQNRLVSQAFSAPPGQTGAAAQRMNEILGQQKHRIGTMQRRLFAALAQRCAGKGNVLHFEDDLDGTQLRELADALAQRCGGVAAVFSQGPSGFAYCLMAREGDLRPLGREMTQALAGRGGGKPLCQQGRVEAGREKIFRFFACRGYWWPEE